MGVERAAWERSAWKINRWCGRQQRNLIKIYRSEICGEIIDHKSSARHLGSKRLSIPREKHFNALTDSWWRFIHASLYFLHGGTELLHQFYIREEGEAAAKLFSKANEKNARHLMGFGFQLRTTPEICLMDFFLRFTSSKAFLHLYGLMDSD